MKITRRTDYAIHLIAELSQNTGKPMGLRTLAERHNVTYAFARTVQKGLLKAGIIKTARGINGGIMLVKDLEDISLLDVYEAAQESLETTFDTEGTSWCFCEGPCISERAWDSTRRALAEHLSTVSMRQVLDGR
ncbi:MAG: Rrf2 family transcriptional regulator [Coriobacteriales bacterium]|jgi:Rrf2 family protein|nr:Rrf2 family transcriptional regulator [Coriobacteriales bacterium]